MPQSRGNGHVLPPLVGVSDRRGVDARSGLELPQRLAGVGIEGNKLARELALDRMVYVYK